MSGTTSPLAADLQALQDQVNNLLSKIAVLKVASTSTSSGNSTAGGTTVATTTTSVTFADTLKTLNSDAGLLLQEGLDRL